MDIKINYRIGQVIAHEGTLYVIRGIQVYVGENGISSIRLYVKAKTIVGKFGYITMPINEYSC